jgi:adenylate cyclase
MQKAFALVFLGRPKEALVTAMDLDLRDADLGNFYWLLGRAYFTLASASTTRRKDVNKYYHTAIHWLQKCVEENPERWYVRAHLIGAYALAGQLAEPEAKAAIDEYRKKFMKWPLDPDITKWARHQRFKRDAHHDFRAAIKALLKGLEEAKAKGFP